MYRYKEIEKDRHPMKRRMKETDHNRETEKETPLEEDKERRERDIVAERETPNGKELDRDKNKRETN